MLKNLFFLTVIFIGEKKISNHYKTLIPKLFFSFVVVLNVFSLSSPKVPKVFPNVPSNISFFYPILFGCGSTPMYLTCKKSDIGGTIINDASNLGREAHLGSYFRKCPMFQKYWWWVNRMAPYQRKINKFWDDYSNLFLKIGLGGSSKKSRTAQHWFLHSPILKELSVIAKHHLHFTHLIVNTI